MDHSKVYTLVQGMNELTSDRTVVARDLERCITIWLDIVIYTYLCVYICIYIYIDIYAHTTTCLEHMFSS